MNRCNYRSKTRGKVQCVVCMTWVGDFGVFETPVGGKVRICYDCCGSIWMRKKNGISGGMYHGPR